LWPTLSHAQLVLENDFVQLLTSNFTGSLGPGAGQVRWAGSGGFAAQGSDRTVRLNNSTTAIDWDAEYFVGEDNTLILGAANANRTLLWDKGLNINVSEARIRVVNGTAAVTRAEAVIQQAIEGWGNLVVEGDGRLDITANNPNFTGEILISGAELRLNRQGRFGAVNNIKIEAGGTLTLDNRGTHTGSGGGQYIANRLNTAAGSQIELAGGTLQHIGQTNANTTTTLPDIELSEGSNAIDIINPTASRFTEAQAKLVRATSSTSTVNFTSNGTLVASGNGSHFKLTNIISDFISSLAGNGSIIPWAVVNGSDFATVNNNGYVTAYNNYTTSPWTTWSVNSNVLIDSNIDATALNSSNTLSVNSLKLLHVPQINIYSPPNFFINSGGLILDSSIRAVGLTNIVTPTGVPLYVNTPSTNYWTTLSVSSALVIKDGPGILYVYNIPNLIIREGTVYPNNGGFGINPTIVSNNKNARFVAGTMSSPTTSSREVKLVGNLDSQYEAKYQLGELSGITTGLFRLTVEGHGVLDFGPADSTIFIRELLIDAGSILTVRSWLDQASYFLVHRNSPNLQALLERINFQGYGLGAATRDYSATYWEIVPLSMMPEPTTYGAIFGVMGLGLWAWRRRVRKASAAARAEGSQH